MVEGPEVWRACAPDPRVVREYWERAQDAYLAHVGTSFQAGRIAAGTTMRESNAWLARAAGLRPGQRVLDAGCGVCGPAMDMAREIDDLDVVGITLVGRQASTARALIAAAGLGSRVRVVQADYHAPPFTPGSFDAVVFFECLGYARDFARVFDGVRRVLRRGGTLYVKDAFRREVLWSDEERRALDEFDRGYALRSPTLAECVAAAKNAGLERIETRDLSDVVSTAHAWRALVDGAGAETAFGRMHRVRRSCVPVYFAQMTAHSP